MEIRVLILWDATVADVGPSWLVDHDQKGVRENNFGKELITVFDKNKSVVITSWTTLDIAFIIIIITK